MRLSADICVGSLLLCCAAQSASSLSAAESWPWSRKKAAAEPTPTQGPAQEAEPAPVAEDHAQKHSASPGPASTEDVLGELTQPGCYMRMPSGCPKAPMRTELWRHDAWAEREGLDKEGCKLRREVWNKYCDAADAQMAFVASQDRSQPLSALQISAEWWPWSSWSRAKTAPEDKPAEAKSVALASAKAADGSIVGPAKPGCYMRMPSGCPKDPMRTQKWRHDAGAEQEGLDEAGCQQRGAVWNDYCGAQDAVMAFVPERANSSLEATGDESSASSLDDNATGMTSEWSASSQDDNATGDANVPGGNLTSMSDAGKETTDDIDRAPVVPPLDDFAAGNATD